MMRMQYLPVITLTLIIVGCFGSIVSANMAAPPEFMTVVHIEKNGIPDDGTLSYSLTCYGHFSKILLVSGDFRNKTENENGALEQVFSASYSKYHLSTGYYWDHLSDECRIDGSTKIEQYCSTGFHFKDSDPRLSELCRLNGSTLISTYSVWNATDKPVVKHSTGANAPTYYEFFFTLPPDHQIPENDMPVNISDTKKSPVESLFCSFLSFFGVKC